MNKILKYIFILISINTPGVFFGQSLINLQDYVILVLERHPQLNIEEINLKIAHLEQDVAKMREDPHIEIAYAHNAESRVFQGPGMEAELSIPIDWWKTRKSRKNIARIQWEQAHLEKNLSQAELKQIARQVYINTFIHLEMEEVLKAYYQSLEDLYLRDSIQFELGALSEIDYKQTKIEKEKASFELLSFEQDRKDLEIMFGILIGEPIGTLQPGSLPKREEYTLPLWSTVSEHSWLLHQKDWEIQEQQEELSLLKKERKIRPELLLGMERHFFEDPLAYNRFSEAKWTIGMGIPLPFSNRNKASLLQQQKRIEKAEWEKKSMSLLLYQEWQTTVNAYEKAQHKVNAFDRSILVESDEWLEQIEFAYQTGHINWINYLNAQNNWRDLKIEYLDNVMNLWEAITQLMFWIEQIQ